VNINIFLKYFINQRLVHVDTGDVEGGKKQNIELNISNYNLGLFYKYHLDNISNEYQN